MRQKEYALIVAGGSGTRFKGASLKQFTTLNGKPVLLHALEAFYRYSSEIEIILVLPGDQFSAWHELVKKYSFNHKLTLQSGGHSRFESVRQGLEKITADGLVAIHDGVRPLVTPELIRESFRNAAVHGCAVCAIPLKESLRRTDATGTRAVDRSAFRLIQTPQTFKAGLIKAAYTLSQASDATDDATVFERAGHEIFLIEGRYDNIKITTADDLVVAEALLRQRL